MAMLIMKFGGASLSDAKNIYRTCEITKNYLKKDELILVVSAMQGVTDKLYEITDLVKKKHTPKALKIIDALQKQHVDTLDTVTQSAGAVRSEIEIVKLCSHLKNFIRNISKKEMTPARTDYIVSFGERLSCRVVAEALEAHGVLAYPLDASYILATSGAFGNALPLYGKSQTHIDHILNPLLKKGVTPVVTGFIGFTHDGCTTTLGRGGSDLSAAFLANFMDADGVYLWKDVPGFYDGDPKEHKDARVYKTLTYDQAEKLSKKGAKIIYWKAIDPVRQKHIPIYIKSYIDPKHQGTKVSD